MERLKAWFYRSFGRTYIASECGHTTKRFVEIDIFGEKKYLYASNLPPEYCPECSAKMAIKCYWCSRTILVGAYITLYVPHDAIDKKEGTALYHDLPVGCVRCAEFGIADAAGMWVPPGTVDTHRDPFFEEFLDIIAE